MWQGYDDVTLLHINHVGRRNLSRLGINGITNPILIQYWINMGQVMPLMTVINRVTFIR